tara:strand:- start:397 stop:801 length:405 start_codon:yes stop_codon:yes gene_type:complete
MLNYLSLIFLFLFINIDLVYCADQDSSESRALIVASVKKSLSNEISPADKWLAIDKLQHFSYSCLISLGCQYVLVNKFNNTETNSVPISSGLSFSAGLLKELNDNKGEKGHFSMKDMVANAAGIIVAALIILHG